MVDKNSADFLIPPNISFFIGRKIKNILFIDYNNTLF